MFNIQLSTKIINLNKRYPLTISRGTYTASENLFVFLTDGEHTGIGEMSPALDQGWTAAAAVESLDTFFAAHPRLASIQSAWAAMYMAGISPPAMAAVDMALWDLLGKRAKLPLYQLLGAPAPSAQSSITIGVNAIDVIRARVPEMLSRTGAKSLKIKLGLADGIAADQDLYMAAKEAAMPFDVKLRVDANGGWDLAGALIMDAWLSSRGCDYIEQPLPEGAEDDLPPLYRRRNLPIFIDESCRMASDVARYADRADGVNLKLMKCGGITEALRIIATARAHNIQTMIGCMSESSVAIAAGAALSGMLDYIDLDSHLNLTDDPAVGAPLVDGVIMPRASAGHGAVMLNLAATVATA